MSLALKLVLSPLLAAQAISTRRRAPVLPEAAGPREGQIGHGLGTLRVLIAGDSSAAGVGVAHQNDAFSGYFTRALNRRTSRPVRWRLVARSGYTTLQVHALLRESRLPVADIAVVLTGVNDVIGLVTPRRAIEQRMALADWLIGEGRAAAVLYSPLPPINQFPLLPQPLRGFMAAEARLHNEAIAAWTATRKDVFHTPIDLQLSPRAMASDGFHPAEPVYRICGETLARFVAEKMLPQETKP